MAQTKSNLPIGAKVKFGHYEVESEGAMPIIWTIVAKNHPGYPANSITLHTEKIIDLRCFDAKEPNNPIVDRQYYGNNRYSVSNIDQWLNKAGSAAGGWYVAQHTYDQSPNAANVNNNTPYNTRPGFLYHFSQEERDAILFTPLRVVKPSVDGGGYEDITRKVFLPSATEVGLGDEGGIAEGTAWGFYISNAARRAGLTPQAFNNTLSDSNPSAIGNGWYWWLRTPHSSYSEFPWFVNEFGGLGVHYAYNGYIGVRPALNLSSFTLVSDTTDADGCYTFVPNTPPTKPSHINVPTPLYRGGTAIISWGASTDAENDLSGYILQRSVNGGAYTQIFKGNALTYTDTIGYGWNTVRYRVCAYDGLDATSDWQESDIRTVINWIEPVWQRTQADVDYALRLNNKIARNGWSSLTPQEQSDWAAGLIGCLNYWDLNRIEMNSEFLSNLLYQYGYGSGGLPVKTDWDMTDFPHSAEMERIRTNVQTLIDIYYEQDVPLPETLQNLDWRKLNDLENVLKLMKEMIHRMEQSFRYSGTFTCGEDGDIY